MTASTRILALIVILPLAASLDVAAVTATPSPASAGAAMEARFSWPLTPEPEVLRGFDPPADPYGPGHRGVDLRAVPGQEVLAAGAGAVVFAGRLAGRGVVSVDHDGVLRTTYEPVIANVVAGDQVYEGQVLGTAEPRHAGCTAAACLHWGVRRGAEYLNPLVLVSESARIRLKPWEGLMD